MTFPNCFKLYHFTKFSPVGFDYTIILTDDDPRWRNEWTNSNTFCIDHHYTNRHLSLPDKNHIGTRFFAYRNISFTQQWALPTYRMIDLETKKNIVKPQILRIGCNVNSEHDNEEKFIKSLPFPQIMIDRNINPNIYANIYANNNNIPNPKLTILKGCCTFTLFDMLKQSQYVLITGVNKDHVSGKSMSASIPLALSCLCTIIMPKEMNKYFKLKSVIEYDDIENISFSNVDIEKINDDLEMMIEKRNILFNSLFI